MTATVCPKCRQPLGELDLLERRVAYCLACDLVVISTASTEPYAIPVDIPRCSADRREAEEAV